MEQQDLIPLPVAWAAGGDFVDLVGPHAHQQQLARHQLQHLRALMHRIAPPIPRPPPYNPQYGRNAYRGYAGRAPSTIGSEATDSTNVTALHPRFNRGRGSPPPVPNAPPLHIDIAVGTEQPELQIRDEAPVGAPLYRMTNKKKVYSAGVKQMHPLHVLPDKEQEEAPLFIYDPVGCTPAKLFDRATPCQRKKLIASFKTDKDLLYFLKLQAAFLPRNESLLPMLKMKATKFMSQYDCSYLTAEQHYKIIMHAIGMAMLVDKEEERIRALLHIGYERKFMRPAHNTFLMHGRTGDGAGSSLKRIAKKACAVRAYFQKKWIRATKF